MNKPQITIKDIAWRVLKALPQVNEGAESIIHISKKHVTLSRLMRALKTISPPRCQILQAAK